MKTSYVDLKAHWQKKINDFPIRWAFTSSQLNDALEFFGVPKSELCSIGAGGIMRKADVPQLEKLHADRCAAFAAAMTDSDFLYDALVYELANHEYCITYDPADALRELDIDIARLSDPEFKAIFDRAASDYLTSIV